MRGLPFSALVLAGAVLATEGRANGRFPGANQLVVDPLDPAHIVVRATFGILESVDGGTRWSWICEQAITSSGSLYEPPVAFSRDATMVMGAPEGITLSKDRGCNWRHVPGPLSGLEIVDLATSPGASPDGGSPGGEIWGAALAFGDAGFESTFAKSQDNGETWQLLSTQAPFAVATIDVAPSLPTRVYASSTNGGLLRSDDGGVHWQTLPDVSDKLPAYIAAVDPKNPDRVYVRLVPISAFNIEGGLLVGDVGSDGGMAWKPLFMTKDPLFGFALSPDGSQIAVGAVGAGVQVASTSDYVFHQVADLKPVCLNWAAAGLYVCLNEATAPYTIGRAADGANFSPLLKFSDLGLLACPAASSWGAACPPVWCATAIQLGVDGGCAADAGGRADAGGEAADASGREVSTGEMDALGEGDPGSEDAGAAPDSATTEPASPEGGCSCRLGARTAAGWPSAAMLVAAAALGQGRRRRFGAPGSRRPR